MKIEKRKQEKWFVPCNVKMFDVVEHFNSKSNLTVKQGRNVSPGDYVYLYVGKPYSRIMFRCIVDESRVSEVDLNDSELYAVSKGARQTPYMRLHLDKVFEAEGLSYHDLLANGLGTVQAQASLPRKAASYISKFE